MSEINQSWRRVLAGLSLGVLVAFATIFAAACGDDDDEGVSTATPTIPVTETATGTPETPTPPPGTPTPTPEAGSRDGFIAMLGTFDQELSRGAIDPIIARLRWEEYTCKASDLEPGLGQPECKTAGEVIRAIAVGDWRSEGGLRKVETVVAQIQALQAQIDATSSDTWGDGTPAVYAFDAVEHKAAVTMMTKCLPQFQCPDGKMRVALVLTFEFEDGRWGVTQLLNAYVLAEEFLEPTEEAKQFQMPNWERFQ
jgi:hypothetical protein